MRKSIKIILSILLIALFSGCQNELSTPKLTAPKIDPSLEGIDREGVKYLSDINSIAFEWQRVKSQRVQGYVIYRSDMSSNDKKLKQIAKIDNIYTSHFLDSKLEPKTTYVYRFSTFDKNGIEAPATKDITITTSDRPEAISYVDVVNNLPKTAKIIWRPHTSERIKGYKIYKNDTKDAEFKEIAKVNGRLNAEYIDNGLEDSKVYKYKIVAFTYDNIDSYQSNMVTCVTKPLPKIIEFLEVSENKPKEIYIKWASSDIKDLVEYRVYRANSLSGSYEVKTKTTNTEYKDIIKEDGKAYFYKITVVDKDGLESPMQDVGKMGKTLSAPLKPIISSISINDNKVVINWTTTDNRAESFIVVKKIKQGWNKSKKINIKDITDTSFVDIEDIIQDMEYEYSVKSVDKNGLISEESDPSVIKIPKKGK